MIEGVVVRDLRPIPDERGMLMEILRSDDPAFRKFGQVYITTAYFDVVKAWHYHKIQWDNFACIRGMCKLVLYDDREQSPTRGEVNEFFLGVFQPKRITIPPGVWHGFKGISMEEALMINVPTEVYHYDQPDEYRRPWNDPSIPYDWSRKNG
jgi:dTDP-4-dehydrorhamnose 3,5-epimerase